MLSNKEYYELNKEKILLQKKQYREDNKEKKLQLKKQRLEADLSFFC